MYNKIIAIDGPAGAGKSTVAKKIARALHYTYIDSGAMYRALTFRVIKSGVGSGDISGILSLAQSINIDFINNSIVLDGENVDTYIRQENVSGMVSEIASIKEVRRIMVEKQREISNNKNVVMDGRDVGTVIFPNAYKKFFITAQIDERAKRRYDEIVNSGKKADLEEIKSQIEKRDHMDTTREDSPLKISDDAIFIDTTGKTIDQVVEEIIREI